MEGVHYTDPAITSDFAECWGGFSPRPRMRFARWCVDHVGNDEGRPYDHSGYPHLAAPGGPCDAIDDQRVRTIAVQFATRLGKSFIGQSMLLYFSQVAPAPMMFASQSRESAEGVMSRIYKQIYGAPELWSSLQYSSEADHKQSLILFRDCWIRGAWAKSPGSLSDWNITYGVANEIDKPGWRSLSTTDEGSPIKLFEERFKDNMGVRKVYFECTPTTKGKSEIERRRLSGSNCLFMVPCPRCGTYQTLRMGARDQQGHLDLEQPGRLAWSRREDGKKDIELARRTAHYVCISGECPPITNDHRARMMRDGVWCPEGCSVKDAEARRAARHWYETLTLPYGDGGTEEVLWHGWDHADWIAGTPTRDGADASFGPLSSLYALSLSWGDFAAEFVSSKDVVADFRNFVNGWNAETWELKRRDQDWETLADRLIDNDIPAGSVPEWASVLTAAVDRQKDHYVFGVMAWGAGRRNHLVSYGFADSLEEIRRLVIGRAFDRNGAEMYPSLTLIDNGYRPDSDVEQFARSCLETKYHVLCCKGSSVSLEFDYRVSRKTWLILVDTGRTQVWIDKVLHTLHRGDPGCGSVHAGSKQDHRDLLEQLLNDSLVVDVDRYNNDRETWTRIDENVPNDYRDVWRYAYAAMLIATRGAEIRPPNQVAPAKGAVLSAGAKRPDGRKW